MKNLRKILVQATEFGENTNYSVQNFQHFAQNGTISFHLIHRA